MPRTRWATISSLVGIILIAAASSVQVHGQGLTVTRVTTPQSMPAGLGGLANLASQLGANIPAEIRESIYLNADGTIKRVETAEKATIYNLAAGYLIEIDKQNSTWVRKTFEEFREQFAQLGSLFGRGQGGGQASPSPPSEAPEVDLSLNLSVEPQGETEDLNGFQDAELFHQFVEVQTSGQPGQTAPGMSGNFVAAMKVWAVERSDFDLSPLHEFDRQLAMELIGVPLGASQDFASSILESQQAQELVAQYEAEMGALGRMEPVSTLTEIYMLGQGQEFDPSLAFQEPAEVEPEPEPSRGGGGGLFGGLGGLGAALGGLGRGGGAPPGGPPAAGGQTPFGSTREDYVDYRLGAPADSLFEAPGAPFQQQ